MRAIRSIVPFALAGLLAAALFSCHPNPPKSDVTATVEDLDTRITKDLTQYISYALQHSGKLATGGKDTEALAEPAAVDLFYRGRGYRPAWSDTGRLFPEGDSLIRAIFRAEDDGLSTTWYHAAVVDRLLADIRQDSVSRKDAVKWSVADILLTDAFMRLGSDLRFGLLPPDSISLRKDSAFSDTVLVDVLSGALSRGRVAGTLDSLRPHFAAYQWLREAFHRYRIRMAARSWDTLPAETGADSADFEKQLARRLVAGGELDSADADSRTRIAEAVKGFQQSHGLYADGVAGTQTVRALNLPARYRLRQVAVNLERWRHRTDSMPESYVWVNIPSYTLELHDSGKVVLTSRVIVGKPGHETPLLSSRLTNFQLYPYWRVPISIIAKEMLPQIRRDTGYLSRNNLEVVDRHNNIVDPRRLNWKKYSAQYFPYVIRQMTGLDNSLGIIKFNFSNKYAVYLHDTNLRNLFGLTRRALSHGCVRVQQWEPLAMYLIRNDTLRHLPDSVRAWMVAQKQQLVSLRTRVPVYLRYYTCRADSLGNLFFYDDIYGYDRLEMEKIYGPHAIKIH